ALAKAWKERIRLVDDESILADILASQLQVLAHREVGKDRAVLGNIAHSALRDLIWRKSRNALAAKAHLARRRDLSHDGLHGRRAPDAIPAEQAHDLPLAHVQAHAVQHVALAVESVQAADLKHARRLRGRPLAPSRR